MAGRLTKVVHTKLSGHMLRVEAARSGASGIQILTMGQIAGRLAGGFLQPIDNEALQAAVRAALAESSLGELDAIKDLPGMPRAAMATFDKLWRGGVDLAEVEDQRLIALRMLETETLRRLPPSMKRPGELAALARERVRFAPTVIGPIEIHGHSEMSPCWRPLLAALARVVPVVWAAGVRSVPRWLDDLPVEVRRDGRAPDANPCLFSCATPHHEALEAIRWMRELIASGKARPEEIAIAAASPAGFDDVMLALSADANMRVHFLHGVRAVTTRDGQTAAALAEALTKGLSQERVRRLFALLGNSSKETANLPTDWPRVLPADAPLTTPERWRQAFSQVDAGGWPDGVDRSRAVLAILERLALGCGVAARVGEELLPPRPLALWRRALVEGPPEALATTLAELRVSDGLEPASHVIWTSAISLASAPRPFVRLLALNAGRWPRRISEDRLIPDHVIPTEELDPLPISDADRRDFETILASGRQVEISFSRRDVEGRFLGRSPLIGAIAETYLSRGRTPDHAESEADRLLARPSEFAASPIAASASNCWRDWLRPNLTTHDGLIDAAHARVAKIFDRPMSATSLKLLMRDPIRFVWRYGLGLKQPEPAEEPLTLDALSFGAILHAVLQLAVDGLESAGGLGRSDPADVNAAVTEAMRPVAAQWETERPVPPPLIWRRALADVETLACRALTFPLKPLSAQKSWTEVPFGTGDEAKRNDLPWDPTLRVEIPGAGGVFIQGHIDRLDLSGDGAQARVVDYKTGRLKRNMAKTVIDGGRELQRCLYAFAVQTLLGRRVSVESALMYPFAEDGEQSFFPLPDVDATLERVAGAIALARGALEAGLALPGVDAADAYNDFRFLLPASAGYLPRKRPLAEERLGEAANVWEAD